MFPDRRAAGHVLAGLLAHYAARDDVLVLALPRGGVPVGYEVARRLAAPLDVFVVRKLGLPTQPELAIGAIASGGVRVLNDDLVRALSVPPQVIDALAKQEQVELVRREWLYRDERPAPKIGGKIVILIDDGLATGSTMRSAAAAIKQLGPARLVVAAPVAAKPTCEELRGLADEVVCALTPVRFFAVGEWYQDFRAISDQEVRDLLARRGRDRMQPAA